MSMAQKTSMSRLRRFWEASSQPVFDGNPKIVRSELFEWLTVTEKLSIRTAEQYLKQNAKDKMIFNLSEMGVIEPLDDGWTVIEPSLSSELLHAKQVAAHAGLVRDGSSG